MNARNRDWPKGKMYYLGRGPSMLCNRRPGTSARVRVLRNAIVSALTRGSCGPGATLSAVCILAVGILFVLHYLYYLYAARVILFYIVSRRR